MDKYRVLIAGCGHMGKSHALAYHRMENAEIVGLVSRNPGSRQDLIRMLEANYPEFSSFEEALNTSKPDIVCISTYTETHAEYAIASFEAGAHVFLEKPVSSTIESAEQVIKAAREFGKKLIVGYILRVHPSWVKFIELALKKSYLLV